MINKGIVKDHPDVVPVSTPSPLSFLSSNYSPITYTRKNKITRQSRYKSPQTTPVSSPRPSIPSTIDRISQCMSQEKLGNHKDNIAHLNNKLQIREKRIEMLEEENKRLSMIKVSENWEKELVKRNTEIRKLECQLKHYKDLASEQGSTSKLLETIEKQNKHILRLEKLLREVKTKNCEDHTSIITDLKSDNIKLIETLSRHETCLKPEDCAILHRQIKELELNLEDQYIENSMIKQEMNKFMQQLPMGSLMYFTQDISKIRKEIGNLLKILLDFKARKDFSLKGILGIDSKKQEPAQQLSNDITNIKEDLNTIFTMISDLRADQYANSACINQ